MNGPEMIPWFGSWPLGKRVEKEFDMKLFQPLSETLTVMITCFFVGLLLIILSHYVPWYICQIVISHIGTAFIVVTIVGFTVEYFLKQQLMQDVFKAAFGYVLPKELVPELQWLCDQTIVTTDNKWDIELKYLDNDKDAIIYHAKSTQVRENYGSYPKEIKPSISIDEWFSPKRKSEIIQLSYIHNSKKWPEDDIKTLIKPKGNCRIFVEAPAIILEKGDKIYVNYEYEEVKHCNDEHISHVSYITKKSQVTVKKPDDIEVEVGFAQRQAAKKIGTDVYITEDTLLPYQFIHVRWYQKEKIS